MTYQILLIEDDPKILFNLKLLLEYNDYKVITATNGIEGLDILSQIKTPPNLILCDIVMPEMGGLEFFQEIAKNRLWKCIPFIFISAITDSDDIQGAKDLGAADFIVKPFDENNLLSIIAENIRREKKMEICS